MKSHDSQVARLGFLRTATGSALLAALAALAVGCTQPAADLPPPLTGGMERDAEVEEDAAVQPEPGGTDETPDSGLAPDEGTVEPADGSVAGDADSPDAGPGDDATALPPDAVAPPPPVRLALDVTNDVAESVWVQTGDESGQPGWVRLTHANQRYYIRELCDQSACGGPEEPVCGAAQPLVRDMTGGTNHGVHELLWDGMVSRIEAPGTEGSCEIREAAPAGDWKATFCRGLAAELDGSDTGSDQQVGHVVEPTCVDVSFRLPSATDVVYHINGG